jgi:DNA-binding transcriptional LysR family regulator
MQTQISKDIIEGTRYFIKLVELGSYSGVKNFYAVELNTIKTKLETVEKYLDIKLIQNIQNKISPTANGIKYYHSCNQIYKDLEKTISGIKHNGFKEKPSLKFLGSPLFIQSAIDAIIPELEKFGVKDCNYVLSDYLLDNMSGLEYQLDKYDVILIYTKNLDYISADDWIVCSTLDSASIEAPLYASNEFIEKHDLNNNLYKIQELPIIFNNYDFTYRVLNYIHNGETYKLPFENVKYIVDNQLHKAKLIQKGLGIGFMPVVHAKSLSLEDNNISAIENIQASYHIEPQLVLINKDSKYLKELVNVIRPVVNGWVNKVKVL